MELGSSFFFFSSRGWVMTKCRGHGVGEAAYSSQPILELTVGKNRRYVGYIC